MNAIAHIESTEFSSEKLVKDLVLRIEREAAARRMSTSARTRRERTRAKILAQAGNDPLAEHPRLMKLRAELNGQKVA